MFYQSFTSRTDMNLLDIFNLAQLKKAFRGDFTFLHSDSAGKYYKTYGIFFSLKEKPCILSLFKPNNYSVRYPSGL